MEMTDILGSCGGDENSLDSGRIRRIKGRRNSLIFEQCSNAVSFRLGI